MRVLGVDPGSRRVGLAAGDTTTRVAVPLLVVEVAGLEAMADVVSRVARDRGTELVVIGLPTDVDGGETPACQRSHALADRLTDAGLRTTLQSEVLTSDEARRRARAAGRPRGAAVDDLAAQVLLEEFLAGREIVGREP